MDQQPEATAIVPEDPERPPVPDAIRNAAIVQLVSGLLNMFVMPLFGSMFLSTFCGIFTGGLCSCIGVVTCLLWPVGLLEVVGGALGLMDPRAHASTMKLISYVEIASIVLGGLLSAAAGVAVQVLLRDDEAMTYLEG